MDPAAVLRQPDLLQRLSRPLRARPRRAARAARGPGPGYRAAGAALSPARRARGPRGGRARGRPLGHPVGRAVGPEPGASSRAEHAPQRQAGPGRGRRRRNVAPAAQPRRKHRRHPLPGLRPEPRHARDGRLHQDAVLRRGEDQARQGPPALRRRSALGRAAHTEKPHRRTHRTADREERRPLHGLPQDLSRRRLAPATLSSRTSTKLSSRTTASSSSPPAVKAVRSANRADQHFSFYSTGVAFLYRRRSRSRDSAKKLSSAMGVMANHLATAGNLTNLAFFVFAVVDIASWLTRDRAPSLPDPLRPPAHRPRHALRDTPEPANGRPALHTGRLPYVHRAWPPIRKTGGSSADGCSSSTILSLMLCALFVSWRFVA